MYKHEIISRQGSGAANEDISGMSQNRFWVLDGASSLVKERLFQGPSDAAGLVRAFSDSLTNIGKSELANADLCALAMEGVREKLGPRGLTDPALGPSFAMVMAHVKEAEIHITCLSDCAAILWYPNKKAAEVHTDNRIEKTSKKTRRVIDHVKILNLPDDERRAIILRQLAKNRRIMNTPRGYFVGTLDGAAFPNAYNAAMPRKDAAQLLLCSDGFLRLFDYGLLTVNVFFQNGATLEDAANLLRAHEMQMPDGAEVKRHDDLTAIRIFL